MRTVKRTVEADAWKWRMTDFDADGVGRIMGTPEEAVKWVSELKNLVLDMLEEAPPDPEQIRVEIDPFNMVVKVHWTAS